MLIFLSCTPVVPLEDNKALRKTLEGVALPTEEIYQVDSEGYSKLAGLTKLCN